MRRDAQRRQAAETAASAAGVAGEGVVAAVDAAVAEVEVAEAETTMAAATAITKLNSRRSPLLLLLLLRPLLLLLRPLLVRSLMAQLPHCVIVCCHSSGCQVCGACLCAQTRRGKEEANEAC